MNTFKKVLAIFIGIPIGLALFIAISILVSLLWIVYGIWSLMNKFMNQQEYTLLKSFEEFIFICYGFAALMLILPFMPFNIDTLF